MSESETLLINVQRRQYVGGDRELTSSWKVVDTFTIDHRIAEERMLLGKTCQEAFEVGDMIITWPHEKQT